jgi:hypothetical protein
MTFEEFAAERLPGVLRFAAILTGDRALAEGSGPGGADQGAFQVEQDRGPGPAGVLRPQDDPQ